MRDADRYGNTNGETSATIVTERDPFVKAMVRRPKEPGRRLICYYGPMDTTLITRLLAGEVGTVTLDAAGAARADDPPHGAILSGSFNPLHHGHEGMASAAARITGLAVSFELAVVNADKGALSPAEIARRAAQFAGRHTLTLSREPLFVGKARLYPGRTFVLGFDTAARLLDQRYYDGEAGLTAALATLAAAGCRFVVAGRLAGQRFYTLADLPVPPAYAERFVAIPEELFRADISSTELRARM